MKQSNPQGKGVVPLLQEWNGMMPGKVPVKSVERLLADYFTSLLVLSAEFCFKPVVGQHYYLYRRPADSDSQPPRPALSQWRLSLVEPERLGNMTLGIYIARCVLQDDMTWSLTPSEHLTQYPDIIDDLANIYQQFADTLNDDQPLEATLPFFAAELPFYRRLNATALSCSIQQSIYRGQLDQLPARQWLANLNITALPLVADQSSHSRQ